MSRYALTGALAEFASARHAFGDEALRRARDAFVDTVGVAVAGADKPTLRILRRTLSSGVGEALVLTDGERVDARYAALLNATAAHVLDYDDVCHSVKGHPSAVLVPALLATAGTASGGDVLHAYIVGLQAGASVGAGLGPGHYAAGWHATSTVGVVAAAVAVSNLLKLSRAQCAAAIGVAASFAAGSRQNFGTMTKSLHAGHAAEWGVTAALLAGNGFTGDPAQLESELGLLTLLGDGDIPRAQQQLDAELVITSDRGLNVKKYPCCYFAHRAIDAALALPIVPVDAIRQIDVAVHPGSTSALLYPVPQTGLQGKFSGPYTVAAAYLDRGLSLASFTDAAVRRSEVCDLMPRVVFREVETPPIGDPQWRDGFAVVGLRERSGEVNTVRVDIPRGDCREPLSAAEHKAKFFDCMDFGGYGPVAQEAHATLAGMSAMPTANGWCDWAIGSGEARALPSDMSARAARGERDAATAISGVD